MAGALRPLPKIGRVSDVADGLPWPPGSATGVGSISGAGPLEAVRLVFGEFPELPHLPELPERGPGADMIGRSAALCVELPVELQPSGWRVADRPGRDLRRALSHLAYDLDALEEVAGTYEGPLKIQAAGPWTLAGALELRHGDKMLSDPGAVRDLIDSHAEGLAAHVAEVRKRVPGAAVLLQLDEPGLPGVLAGTVPTASGFGRLAPVEEAVAQDGLRRTIERAGVPVAVHCCAPLVPITLLRRAGAAALSVDTRLLRREQEEPLGEAIEAGVGLFLGVVDRGHGGSGRSSDPAANVEPVRELWRRLGFRPELLPVVGVVTPACGLAGLSPAGTRAVFAACRTAARVLRDEPG
ncbi:MAG: methionine synthase [Streptosporangiales bacterium]|nr:methionine synthase [Streptosporangiales bacterium]